jgi:aerobic C4-dicarboxylate transport protein
MLRRKFLEGAAGFGAISALGGNPFVGGFYVTCIFFIAVVFGPIAAFCGFSLLKLIRYIWEELLVCVATTSSETVLPRIITKLENAGCESSIVGLVVPMGYSFNLDGTCLYLATASVFLAQATNTSFDLSHQVGLLLILLVTSKGAAGIAGAAFVALLLGVHRLMSQAMTPTNLLGNALATIIVAKWENALDHTRLNAVLDGGSYVD